MRRPFAFALGAVGLSWLAGAALADDKAAPKPELAPAPKAAAPVVVHDGHNYNYAGLVGEDCGCNRGGGLTAGVGFYYIKPVWSDNPAFAAFANADVVSNTTQQDFEWDSHLAPVLWIGYGSQDGLGARLRYFHFDQSPEATAFNVPDGSGVFIGRAFPLGIGDGFDGDSVGTFAFESDLQIRVIDLEVTRAWNSCGWSGTFAGGIRYAHISQAYNAFRLDADGVNADVLLSGHNFHGFGPTAAAELRYGLGGGLSAFSSVRGSVLYGHTREQATFLDFGIAEIGNINALDFGRAERSQLLPILELEVGAEWGTDLGSSRLFVQTAFVTHLWFNAGNAANSEGITGTGVPDESIDRNATLGLVGLKVVLGITY